MSKRKKVLKIAGIVFGSIVILLVVSIVIAHFFLGNIVKTAVEKIGPQALGAPVTVKRVHINLFEAAVEINELFVGSPNGYKHGKSLTVKKLRVDLLTSSLTSKKIVVEEFTLDGVDVYFEPSSTLLSNNLSQLNQNIQAFTQKLTGPAKEPKKEEPAKKPEAAKDQPKLQVDQLSLTNIYVNVVASVPGSASTAAPIPVVPIVLEGLGKDNDGVTAIDVVTVILNKLTLGVFTSVADVMPSMKSITDAGSQVLGSTADAGKAILDSTSGAVKSLGSLIPGTSSDPKADAKAAADKKAADDKAAAKKAADDKAAAAKKAADDKAAAAKKAADDKAAAAKKAADAKAAAAAAKK